MTENSFSDLLKNYGQERFLKVFSDMDEADRRSVLGQADLLNFGMLKGLERNTSERGVITPIKTMTMEEIAARQEHYREIGLKALREGKLGAVVLAGGMGTRLGASHAKGMCDIGLTRPVYIFQCMIENMLKVVKEAGCFFPLYIMTSHINDQETRIFFKEHDWFGYDPDHISFFVQDMAPCLDRDGQFMLEAKDRLAMSPNGNGGFYSSMIRCGVDVSAKKAGIKYLNVFAVDNVLQQIADPVFLGAVIESKAATGAKVVRKADPYEHVGAMCLEDGYPSVVEYYEMTDELRNAVDENGAPAYDYGVILNYLFELESIDKVVKNELPIHVISKKIPYYVNKETVVPEESNGLKLETLVLDLVHLMGTCLPFEVDREKEFAPIKNREGVDSVDTARELLVKNGYKL